MPTEEKPNTDNASKGRNGSAPQTRENEDGATPERQIAQEKQQSTGQGTGQS